jgi:hypothetical protein
LLAASLLVVTAAAVADDTSSEGAKLPIPKFAEQSKSERLVHQRYAVEYARKDPVDQLDLARKMQAEIGQFADDPPTRFVMLRESRELAIDGGDLQLAFAAIAEMDREFNIDAREMRYSAMSVAVDKAALTPPELIAQYLKIADDALDVGDVDQANKANTLADMLATQSGDSALQQRTHDEHIAIMTENRRVKAVIAAVGKLRLHPDDPAANELVGEFYCFTANAWADGLPHLAEGTDPKLKALAEAELKPPADAAAMAALADAWWDYFNPEIGAKPEKVQRHAVEWYRRALPGLSGETKAQADHRIAQFGG